MRQGVGFWYLAHDQAACAIRLAHTGEGHPVSEEYQFRDDSAVGKISVALWGLTVMLFACGFATPVTIYVAMLPNLIGAILGIVAVFQKRKKALFRVLGIVLNVCLPWPLLYIGFVWVVLQAI